MRVVTHARVFGPPSTLAQAAAIKGIAASQSCEIVRPGAAFLHRLLLADARQPDAQIAALCRERGIGTVLTNDRDFEHFEALRTRCLDRRQGHPRIGPNL